MKNNETLEDLLKEFKEVAIRFKDELINSGEEIKKIGFYGRQKIEVKGCEEEIKIYFGSSTEKWGFLIGSNINYTSIYDDFTIRNKYVGDKSILREIIDEVNKKIDNMSSLNKTTRRRSLKFMENGK